MRMQKRADWYNKYEALNLCGGHICFILEDDEDMIEIRYDDGMLIDVGKPLASDCYYITVVSSDDEAGWKTPLTEMEVLHKTDLLEKIQQAILEHRN